jgi:hypothetical protein
MCALLEQFKNLTKNDFIFHSPKIDSDKTQKCGGEQ